MTPEERAKGFFSRAPRFRNGVYLAADFSAAIHQARAEALEEAAKEADEWRNMCEIADGIAAAIRALKDGEPKP